MDFKEILNRKIEHYGKTEAAYEFAAEEYANKLIKEAQTEQLTLYSVVSSFLIKQAESRNTPVDELYLSLDKGSKEIDLHYDVDNEGHLRYMDSYK